MLAALQITPNSSVHILAESAENIPANLQSGVHDWVDLRGRSDVDQAGTVTEAGQPATQADKVQHEVAALKMAQGLLKGISSSTTALSLLHRGCLDDCGEMQSCMQQLSSQYLALQAASLSQSAPLQIGPEFRQAVIVSHLVCRGFLNSMLVCWV